jgi:hypothetical protein
MRGVTLERNLSLVRSAASEFFNGLLVQFNMIMKRCYNTTKKEKEEREREVNKPG